MLRGPAAWPPGSAIGIASSSSASPGAAPRRATCWPIRWVRRLKRRRIWHSCLLGPTTHYVARPSLGSSGRWSPSWAPSLPLRRGSVWLGSVTSRPCPVCQRSARVSERCAVVPSIERRSVLHLGSPTSSRGKRGGRRGGSSTRATPRRLRRRPVPCVSRWSCDLRLRRRAGHRRAAASLGERTRGPCGALDRLSATPSLPQVASTLRIMEVTVPTAFWL